MIGLTQQFEFLVFIILISTIFIVSYLIGRNKKDTIIRQFYALGTVIQLRVYGTNGERAIQEAIERLNDIDDKMSVFKENSDVL